MTIEPRYKTEHRGMYAYRYRSLDGGKSWEFMHSTHENVSQRLSEQSMKQHRIQTELK
jgi:hypothetical protein